MSRATGPRVKVMRALGVDLPGLSPKKIERRPYPPGQHGQARKKLSEYALRLQEKQKIRMNYGLSERKLRALMVEAKRITGPTGTNLLSLVERRLDNVVFRAGFARTIPEARQIVNHGHILVDGRRVDIASYRVDLAQVISVREKSMEHPSIVNSVATPEAFQTSWLEVDKAKKTAKVTTLPDETSVLFPIKVQLVVEYYSKRL